MTHLIVAPIVLPAIIAALSLLFRRRRRWLGAAIGLAGCGALLLVALALFARAYDGAISVYALGKWPAPFGIVLVLDRLSALMLLLTSVLAMIVLCHAVITGLDRKGWHFHPLFQFLLVGLDGAFLTGDLFNLFVFFEVLLIASYGLMLHGQGASRLKAGIQYIVINLVGSTLFLIGIGVLYGVTGTLNMADMALRIAKLTPGDQGLAGAGALLLTLVFALKAALLPLHLWLPRTYASTAPAVAALFAIMTKIGVYSLIRVTSLIFGAGAGTLAWLPARWMLPASLLTVMVGFIGLLPARGLREQAAFGLVGSTGTLLVAVSLFEPRAMAAALYYLPHTTLAGALLFLVGDLIARRRPDYGDAITVGPRFANIEVISVLYMLAAIALAGMPPLSGFIGKLLILDAVEAHPAAGWIWAMVLGTTLIAIIGLARTGSTLFWKSSICGEAARPAPGGVTSKELLPSIALIILMVALVVGAGPITVFCDMVSAQLFAPQGYVEAVLGKGVAR
ncbi:monovalent cation/H+ antiporter subunit D [Edaphosphingomonas haloaromaticamans]|uniref:Na(+)/H(+) antiporter subunit D n=1 Tax=Edaphosphingomonas haloaromaticamans TaxID=653954 RepID=A0A1S1HHH3_9SPHN|nr:monovalent cation/H+ antiporter subunit D [Sphingomonas haloaromaticamans]OHT21685.1 Na(+)/H(+) antiporter subunit D [Sphingomonas haloaromaticamans]